MNNTNKLIEIAKANGAKWVNGLTKDVLMLPVENLPATIDAANASQSITLLLK